MNLSNINTATALIIKSPSVSEGIYDCKIVKEDFIVKNVKSKKGSELQIVQMEVQPDNSSPFVATVLDYTRFQDKKLNDSVKVRVFVKEGYRNAEVI